MNPPALRNELLLSVRNLNVAFGGRIAVRDINLDVFGGETLGVVGESGSGKTTLARAILRLTPAAAGRVAWQGEDLLTCTAARLRTLRREFQIVFQNPVGSLDPRMSVGAAVQEPLRIFEPQLSAAARQRRAADMLERVGLSVAMGARYPHEFSGGQCQRIAIARAMMLNPKLLICDEPVSSLDVSIQGQVINLLLDLQRDTGISLLFISHNLAVVRQVSHRILVMQAGSVVEAAERDVLFEAPQHPYTRSLLAAVPRIE
jgi:ABC-type glutathione transport system ATPase component